MYAIGTDKDLFIYVIKGKIEVNSIKLLAKEGLEITNELLLEIKSLSNDSHFLIFDSAICKQ